MASAQPKPLVVLGSRLPHPVIDQQLTIHIQADTVVRRGCECIGSGGKIETSLPAARKIISWQAGCGRPTSPIVVDAGLMGNEAGISSKIGIVEISHAKLTHRRVASQYGCPINRQTCAAPRLKIQYLHQVLTGRHCNGGRVLGSRLRFPTVNDQLPVNQKAHPVIRQGTEDIITGIEVKLPLPVTGEIVNGYAGTGAGVVPRMVDVGFGGCENRRPDKIVAARIIKIIDAETVRRGFACGCVTNG